MRVLAANGAMLHWRQDGDLKGTPVVFANSLGTDLRLWDAVLPLLPSGFRFVRFDKRGHGLSSLPKGPCDMDVLSQDAAALIDGLELKNVIFVGLSIGGMMGLNLAAMRPDLVRALVLSNSAARMGTPQMWHTRIKSIEAGGIATQADPILDRWFGSAFRRRSDVAAWRAMLTRTDKAGYLAACDAIRNADLGPKLADLSVPMLAISGAEDGACPAEATRATAEQVARARFEIIPAVGHLPCVEDPVSYAALLGAFLEEHRHAG